MANVVFPIVNDLKKVVTRNVVSPPLAIDPDPVPSVSNGLLLEDGICNLLLEDGVCFLLLE